MFYSEKELSEFGIKHGQNVKIHKSVLFFGSENIKIGSNVRIDAHAILSAKLPLTIGSFVHIAGGCYIYGSFGVEVGDYCGLSARTIVYSASDDYRHGYLTGPTVPDEFRKLRSGKVVFGKHCIVGAGTIIMPNVNLGTGSSIGALSLVSRDVPNYSIAAGNPLQVIGERNKVRLQELEDRHTKLIDLK